VVLDLAWRQLAEGLHLDLVDHGVEDVLARAEADAAEDADDHALLVLARLVAEPDGGRLAARAELVGDERRVEVEGVHRGLGVYEGDRRTCALVSSAGEEQPSRASVIASSSRRSSSTWRTPASPAAASPNIGARPASTARAPSARAFATSVPRRMPPSR